MTAQKVTVLAIRELVNQLSQMRKVAEEGRVRAEEAVTHLEMERALRERFVATLTHDLRNPLTAAKISAQLLKRTLDRPELVEKASNRVVQSLERADKMIQNLLDANRIKAGKHLSLPMDYCDLTALARSALEGLGSQCPTVKLDAPSSVSGYWNCESLTRVIENLLSNAVKYGDHQKPVTVSLRDEDRVKVSVHNYGNPIPVEEQASVFQDYHRSDSAQLSGKQGWGLGLTLVRGIAESHGGKVQVESSPDLGTTFSVVLPRDSRPFQESELSESR